MSFLWAYCLLTASLWIATTFAQSDGGYGPHIYPGMPSTPYGPDWQHYFKVNTWPYVNFSMPVSYAGSVSVNRADFVNNTLFFVAFEKGNSSLVAAEGERSSEPWMIWLNGGPGSSSMYGLFEEHGPLRYSRTVLPGGGSSNQFIENPFSWHRLADIFYVDQPVGTGYSTVSLNGEVPDEDAMGQDFAHFLSNLVSIFPSLRHRPLYLVGESYAGTYIPYIAKTLFGMTQPPVRLAKIAIGDGTLGSESTCRQHPIPSILQTYPQLINFSSVAYEYYVKQWRLCRYNAILEYPAKSLYPPLGNPDYPTYARAPYNLDNVRSKLRTLIKLASAGVGEDEIFHEGRIYRRRSENSSGLIRRWDSAGIDSYFGCDVWENMIQYATEQTPFWETYSFDVYRISDALNPPVPSNTTLYLNDPKVRAALHAPDHRWQQSRPYPFSGSYVDPSAAPDTFLSELSKNVSMVFFSGNDDALVAHRGTELTIQNMTFGGIQGFTARPSTPFSDTDGNFAGIIHQERNVTYALFIGAGHMVPTDKPKAAYAFIREFVLGTNTTGLLTKDGDNVNVVGGVHSEYLSGIFPAKEIYTGSGRIEGTYTLPQATWDAWSQYMATMPDPGLIGYASSIRETSVSPSMLLTTVGTLLALFIV